MTLTTEPTTAVDASALAASARDHLWMHFTRMSAYQQADVPVITRGEGPYIWDDNGKRYLDGLAGLFVVQAGHGRTELAEAAARQASELAFFPLWSYAHPKAVELAERLAHLAPGDLNRVFFTTGGGEAVESRLEGRQAVLQAHRQADEAQGHQPQRRLPRHPARRAVDHRHPRREGDVRAARAGRAQGAQHQLLPRSRARRRPGGVRPLGGRPHRGGHRVRGSRDRGRGVPRAGAELRRLLPAAARLLRSGSARSATSTTCCSCPTRSSARSGGSATTSAPTGSATSRTSSPAPRA